MRRYITLLLITVAGIAGGYSQQAGGRVQVSGVHVFPEHQEVGLSFRLAVPRKTIPRGRVLVFTPVITDGHYRVSLCPVVVRGKGSEVLWSRYERTAGKPLQPQNAVYAVNGQTLDYTDHVSFQPWMRGARIQLESLLSGCCGSERLADDLLADSILLPPIVLPQTEPQEEPLICSGFIPITTGDTLSLSFPFVVPFSRYNAGEPIYDEDRENALIVYYRLNESGIDPDYDDNRQVLVNLVAAVDAILKSEDTEVSHIVIAGFSSPEGRFAHNDRLAWNRAIAVKRFITAQTGIAENLVSIYNGSEDWRGLRLLVAGSDLPDKTEILRIIDSVPILSSDARRPLRLNEIRRLNGGRSYEYMSEYFFPLLRNGAFIRVYYENR